MKKRNILIVGHKGLIGKYLVIFYKNDRNVKLVCVDKGKNFDLTKHLIGKMTMKLVREVVF